MQIFEELCPYPPEWAIEWDRIHDAFEWIRALAGVQQDPHHHGEGDVATHTRMAAQALAGLTEWRSLNVEDRVRLFATVLLHDVAKPYCTQHEADGRITAHGHSRRGDLLTRQILWRLGAPVAWREHVAALVRHHQVPFWALERQDLQRIVVRVSLLARNSDLALLATADILGRICGDLPEVLENIELYREYCRDLSILDQPWPFASDHARFTFFRTPGRDLHYNAYDDTICTMTILSGLPGVGKDTWLSANAADRPVVSLDALRAELGVAPSGDQRAVTSTAHERAREHLRAQRSFVWNATNISRQQRDLCIELGARYHARVDIVALEAPEDVIRHRNRARPHPVPDTVIDRLIRRWEAPDLTEAHAVDHVDTARPPTTLRI